MKFLLNGVANGVIAICASIQFLFSQTFQSMIPAETKTRWLEEIAEYSNKNNVAPLQEFVNLLATNTEKIATISDELLKCNQLLSEWKLISAFLGITTFLSLSLPSILRFFDSKKLKQTTLEYPSPEFEAIKREFENQLKDMKLRYESLPKAGEEITLAPEEILNLYQTDYAVFNSLLQKMNKLRELRGSIDPEVASKLTNAFVSIYENNLESVKQLRLLTESSAQNINLATTIENRIRFLDKKISRLIEDLNKVEALAATEVASSASLGPAAGFENIPEAKQNLSILTSSSAVAEATSNSGVGSTVAVENIPEAEHSSEVDDFSFPAPASAELGVLGLPKPTIQQERDLLQIKVRSTQLKQRLRR